MVHVDCAAWHLCSVWAKPIRKAVFVQEQGIDESEEWDEADATAVHAIAWLNDQAVGTGRLLVDGKIGRMAVHKNYRGKGVGAAILNTLIELARQQGHDRVTLSAQAAAIGFYEHWGFVPVGPAHEEVGIAHQWMCLELN
ncbi:MULTISPECIES: GNAT family N-acetyltransferase [Limnobacter]|uniref:GNAT family N-acetyltransferase n=1 Tax=Limnobacter TaxID=131079 RepID=UPI0024E140FD|nr:MULTISPECIES: GNAT family N-acetyltransferase [Limnobacter]HEX5486134.1 GNAT family N-acetyltransferase [Limnobacter sp.]